MKKFLPVLICCLLIAPAAIAQVGSDTLLRKDTIPVKKDSTFKKDTLARRDTSRRRPDTTIRRRDTSAVKPPLTRDSAGALKPKTTPVIDSAVKVPPAEITPPAVAADTVSDVIPAETGYHYSVKGFQKVLTRHPYFNFFGKPLQITAQKRKSSGKEGMFYFMTGLLIYYGLIRLFFGRYVDNLLTLFFRATMRQQQIRDQLLQSPLPSLLLNLLFLVSGGLFISFVAFYHDITPVDDPWLLVLYSAALLMAIYLGKFIALKLTGWIFNVSSATDTYIFIVFLVNKIIGITLLPVLVVMAFAGPLLFAIMLTLAYTMLVIFIIYRFIISYKPIRNEIRVNRFHFFLYLCAFEIAPLLLIYKVLLIFVERSH